MYFGRASSKCECKGCFKGKFTTLPVNMIEITVIHAVQSKLQLKEMKKENRWMGI